MDAAHTCKIPKTNDWPVVSAAAGAGASFAASGGRVIGCAMQREIEPARTELNGRQRDRPESSANCPLNACRLSEVVPFKYLSNLRAKQNRLPRCQAKRMGEAALTRIASLTPIPFMEPVILRGRSTLRLLCTYIHLLASPGDLDAVARRATPPTSLPAGN